MAGKRRVLAHQCAHTLTPALATAGVGKSTLINGARGLIKGNTEYAVTSAGRVGTTFSAKYPHAGIPQLVLWDIPGGGEMDHPSATYWTDQCLHAFDLLLIVIENRCSAVASMVARRAAAEGRPYVFVHTKARFYSSGDAAGGAGSHSSRESLQADARSGLQEALGAVGGVAPLFLVESFDMRDGKSDFDEVDLLELLVRGARSKRVPPADAAGSRAEAQAVLASFRAVAAARASAH